MTISRDREGRYIDRIPVKVDILVSLDGRDWQTVAQMTNRAPQIPAAGGLPPYQPPAQLPDPQTWDGMVQYALLCEKATWEKMDVNDHLSPHQANRPALPGGRPYWGRMASLSSVQRVLTQMAEMVDRLSAKGIDVAEERHQLTEFGKRATTDEKALYLEVRLAKRRLMFRDPDLAVLERILFVKRHPYLSSHNYSDVLDSQFRRGGGICVLEIPRVEGRIDPKEAKLRTLFDASDGIARDPMADFDGQRVFFAYRPDSESGEVSDPYWHLMVVRADGSGAEQLTDGPFHDYYPCPLPDGGLAFISTRCQARFLCWRPQAFVLFRMDADGEYPAAFARQSQRMDALGDARRPHHVDPLGVPRQRRRLRPHAVGHSPRRRRTRTDLRQQHAELLHQRSRGARHSRDPAARCSHTAATTTGPSGLIDLATSRGRSIPGHHQHHPGHQARTTT